MCGIVGYFGKEPVEDILIKKLKLLEYRGYDSAGIAVKNSTSLKVTKAVGEISNLKAKLKPQEQASRFVHIIKVNKIDGPLQTVLNIIPWQIIAYYMSLYKGNNPDRPRNLAKSVTVE